MENKLDYFDTTFTYIDEKKYRKAIQLVHKYAEEVLSGRIDFDKTNGRFERIMENLGECSCENLPQGGICFVDENYDMALDDLIVALFSSYIPDKCFSLILACIRHSNVERGKYIISEVIRKKGSYLGKTAKRKHNDNILLSLFNSLIHSVTTTVLHFSCYKIHEIDTQETKQAVKKIIEEYIDEINDPFEKELLLRRLFVLECSDINVKMYDSFIRSLVPKLPKTNKEWRMMAPYGNQLWYTLIHSISDYWNIDRYDMAIQMYKIVTENDLSEDHVWNSHAQKTMKTYLQCAYRVYDNEKWQQICNQYPEIVNEFEIC